jgi:isopenicillin N synthase-like dioxygenase
MAETIRDGEVSHFADYDNSVLRQPSKRASLARLPVIDIAPFVCGGDPAAKARVGAELRQACIDIGFFYLVGHGIAQAETDRLHELGEQFFRLPIEDKAKIDVAHSPTREGYFRPGGYGPTTSATADIKERFQYHRPPAQVLTEAARQRTGQPQWPAIEGFEAFIRAHTEKRVVLAQQLARAFAVSLHLPEHYFDAFYRNLSATMMFNYYPPIDPAELKPDQWSFSPHTDYGTFTILSQDRLGGLQARNSSGEWIDVPPMEDTFVINVGDTLQMWTNDVFVSTLHRAANTFGKARISVAFFTEPQEDTLVECLPTCQSGDNPPKYPPVISHDYTRSLIEQAHRTGRPGVSTRTAERFGKKAGQGNP